MSIKTILDRLPENAYKKSVRRRLDSQNLSDRDSAWYELMIYDWLESLGKKPIPEPTIPDSSSKPDFLIRSEDLEVFVEVFVVQESEEDKNTLRQPRVLWTADTATFWRMGGRLTRKMGKYSEITETLGAAYVICACLESHLLNLREVATYFLGNEAYNLATGTLQFMMDGQIFERHADEPPSVARRYRHISALLAVKRFRDTPKSDYRLEFGLIQNPFALNPIPEDTFGPIRRFVVVSKTETQYAMDWVSCQRKSV